MVTLQLNSQEFISLYRASLSYVDRDFELDEAVRKMEDVLQVALHELSERSTETGYDRWVAAEKSKIKDLEDELEKISESVPRNELLRKFKPVKSKKTRGRPKKSK